MKKQKRTVFLMVLAAFAFICTNFVACKNGSGDAGAQNGQEQTENKNEETPVVNLKTIILGNFSEDEKGAFKRLFPNSEFGTSVAQVDESYKVVICDIDDIPEKIAEDAYYILYTLDKTAFDNVMKVHEEEYEAGLWTEEAIEEMREYVNKWPYLFYGINMKTGAEFSSYSADGNDEAETVQLVFGEKLVNPIITAIESGEESATDLLEDDGALETDHIVGNMTEQEKLNSKFESLARWINNKESDYSDFIDESRALIQELSARDSIINKTYNLLEDKNMISDDISYSVTKSYCPKESRPKAGYDGTFKHSISYAYTPILVSNDFGTPGLYYLVKANFRIDNRKMWFGASDKFKGLRMVGTYFKNFEITFTPTVTGGGSARIPEALDSSMPVSGGPDETTLQTGFTFNLGGKVSGNAGYEGGGKDPGPSGGGEAAFNVGAEWSDGQTMKIKNLKIENITDSMNGIAGWHVSVPQSLLPKYRYWAHNQYDTGVSECQNMCKEYSCSWRWFIPFDASKAVTVVGGKSVVDLSKLPKLKVLIEVSSMYGTQHKNNAAGQTNWEVEWKNYYTFKRDFPVTNTFGKSQLVYITK